MQEVLKIFNSGPAVAIAWVCTVVSCVYAFIQESKRVNIIQKFNLLTVTHNDLNAKNSSLHQEFELLEISYSELKIQNMSLEQKIIKFEKNDIHDNYQEVNQNGNTNINQGVIKGDFNYNK